MYRSTIVTEPVTNNPRYPTNHKYSGCKRKYEDAFGNTFDDMRYNQHISSTFFTNNIGHNVVIPCNKA